MTGLRQAFNRVTFTPFAAPRGGFSLAPCAGHIAPSPVRAKDCVAAPRHAAIGSACRVQLMHIARDLFGFPEPASIWCDEGVWTAVHQAVCDALGVQALSQTPSHNRLVDLFILLQTTPSVETLLAVMEAMLRHKHTLIQQRMLSGRASQVYLQTVKTFNQCCQSYSLGYAFDGTGVVRLEPGAIRTQTGL